MIDRQLEHGKKEEEIQKKEVLELFKERGRAHITVHGKVQGIFYRDWTKKTADKLGLTGWVRNTNETVEIVAEGDKMKLRELILECQKGPPMAKVEKVDYEWEEYSGKFTNFYINY